MMKDEGECWSFWNGRCEKLLHESQPAFAEWTHDEPRLIKIVINAKSYYLTNELNVVEALFAAFNCVTPTSFQNKPTWKMLSSSRSVLLNPLATRPLIKKVERLLNRMQIVYFFMRTKPIRQFFTRQYLSKVDKNRY